MVDWSVAKRLMAGSAVATVIGLAPAFAQDPLDVAGIEVLTVTAQKQEESLLDVPIAVTAFDAEALDARQIEEFQDIQLNVPNVSFTTTNFTGSNFQIRGIGASVIATSADSGVGVHVNDVYLNSPRLNEIEYFDVERLEILRGPQGTLYGRNATGGTANVITAKPDLTTISANVEGQYGNFNHKKVKGFVNVPILDDTLGVRIAGIWNNRDGFIENEFDGEDIDGRDQYAIRGSVRWTPTASTTLDVMASYFSEDSDRVRAAKQKCTRDPSGVLGCLPGEQGFDVPNGNATLAGILTSNEVLGPLGLGSLLGPGGGANANNPDDIYTVNLDFPPQYTSDETFVMAQLRQEFLDDYEFVLLAAYQDTSVVSNQDFNNTFSGDAPGVPAALQVAFPNVFNTYYSGGSFPVSQADPNNAGIVGGRIAYETPFLDGYDESTLFAEQYSIEARIASQYDGPLNFLAALYYLDSTSESDYYVIANQLDYFALVGSGVDGLALVSPFFNNRTDEYNLTSYAAFGELYYEVTDSFKLTGGLRYTVDEKEIVDREGLSDGVAPIGTSNASGLIDDFRTDSVEFNEFTGRFIAEWTPEFDFTDDTLIYASFSRGYKGGGFNPASFLGTDAATFDPEFVNAIEFGTKNTLFDNRLQASLTGFYYDYNGYQVSRIANRTAINENVDASIWGLEAEFVAAPTSNLLFNMAVSYLNTSIGDFSTIDQRDPSGGRFDVTLLKDLQTAGNCVIEHNGLPDPVTLGVVPQIQQAGIPYIERDTPGIGNSAFSSCDGLAQFFDVANLPYEVTDGVEQNLEGNELPNSPNLTLSFGAQHTYDFNVNGYDMSLQSRADYYWQGEMYARTFNTEADRIEGFDRLNASVTVYGPEQQWYVRGYVQNALDDDSITGQYVTDSATGLFTNVFALDPRTYGVTLGVNF